MNAFAELSNNAPALLFTIQFAVCVVFSWLIATRFCPSESLTERFISFSIIFIGFIMFVTTIAGAICVLKANIYLSVFICMTLFAAAVLHNRPNTWTNYNFQSIPLSISIAAALTGLALLFMFGWGLFTPPPPWDAFVYHLRFPASWMQAGRIFLVTVPYGDQAGTYFPSNMELIYTWMMFYLGSDFVTNTMQWFFLILAMASCHRIAISLGFSRRGAAWCLLLCAFIPEALHQTAASEVDVAFAALFLATIALLMSQPDKGFSLWKWNLACVCFGVFLGTKYIAMTFGVFLLPFFISQFREQTWKRLVTFVSLPLIFGGYWYIRNFALTGNPIFPLRISVGGHTLFPGGYGREAMLGSIFHSNVPMEFFQTWIGQAGLVLSIVFLAAAPFALYFALKSARRRIAMYLWALPFLMAAVFTFVIPYNREGRFLYAAMFLCCMYPARVVDSLKGRLQIAVEALLLIVVFANLWMNPFFRAVPLALSRMFSSVMIPTMKIFFLISLTGGCAILALLLYSLLHNRAGKTLRDSAFVLSLCLFFFITSYGKRHYPDYQYPYYGNFAFGSAWQWMQRTLPPSTIAFSGTDISYGLYGVDLLNSVKYVSVNREGDPKFHDYVRDALKNGTLPTYHNDRINLQRKNPDYDVWLKNLESERVDVLFLAVLHPNDFQTMDHDAEGFPIENEWAAGHPQSFQPVYATRLVRIFRVKRDSANRRIFR